jgi:hypothetical protein
VLEVWVWLGFAMAEQWKWKVEAKEFELVVRGGNTGVRFYERNSKTNRSIFLQRSEIAWLDSVVEDLAAVKISEVFWDQSRAGFPRIIVEKCSNRHGNFLMLIEFDGRFRRGSIMIPEGRHGQGWSRLKMEVNSVNSALGVREKWRYNKVTPGRSFAEVVRDNQADGYEVCTLKNRHNKAPVSSVDGSMTEPKKVMQASVLEKESAAVVGDGSSVGLPVCGGSLTASLLPKNLSKPVFSGMEALKGRMESAGNGHASLGQLRLRAELQNLKTFLTKVKEDVDLGVWRVEVVMGLLEVNGLEADLGVGQNLGNYGAVGCTGSKPKRNKKRRVKRTNKMKKNPPEPNPNKALLRGDAGVPIMQRAGETRSFQAGESSEAGARRAARGALSSGPSILGKAEWVHKSAAPATLSVLGSTGLGRNEVGYFEEPRLPPVLCPASLSGSVSADGGRNVMGQPEEPQLLPASLSVLGPAVQGRGKMGSPSQMAPAEVTGHPEEPQLLPASLPVLGPAVQGRCKMVAPAEVTGSRVLPGDYGFFSVGHSEETQLTPTEIPVSLAVVPGCFGTSQPEDYLSKTEENELSDGTIQPLLGGEHSEETNQMGVEVSVLVPWQSGKVILDSGGLGSSVDGEPIPLEICFGRCEGDGVAALPQQTYSPGMELVPFVDGEPISQDWMLAMDDGNSGGSQGADREMELIMAFRRIVGVSCDGHVERLKAAFAHILAGKKKEAKKNRGGGQVGRKGTREILNLFTSVNYEGGSGSVTRSRGKGRGNRLMQ